MIENDCKQYYHLTLLMKKAWQILEKATSEKLYSCEFKCVEKLVRFFIPLLDSSIVGLTNLITNLFQSIIKWSSFNKHLYPLALNTFEFFSNDLLNEFFPFTIRHSQSSYPLCKINLRYLKIVVQSCGVDCIVEKLPILFDFLLQSIAINHTASISGDIFTAALKQSALYPANKNLMVLIERFMVVGCKQFWFPDCSSELQTLNFALFVVSSCVKNRFEDMVKINDRLLERLISEPFHELSEHNLFMWISSFVFIYPENKQINEKQAQWVHNCLWHVNDHIRIAAYKFVCDHYCNAISKFTTLNLANILDVLVNNLTSDNPGFRNHMMSATKRLFVFLRDSVVSHLSNKESVLNDIALVMQKMDHLNTDRVIHLELISWSQEMDAIEDIHHREIALYIIFCRFIYKNQWFNLSLNYQRQRSLVDLITIIWEVIIDNNFLIDKKCGFGPQTVLALREFYHLISDIYLNNSQDVIHNILYAITVTKSDIQNSLFLLLFSTYSSSNDDIKKSINMNDMWIETQALCHSSQPIQLNAGSLFCSFLSKCHYQTNNHSTIVEYLINFLEHLASIDIYQVLNTSLKTPGHGFLMSIEALLKQPCEESVLISDRIPLAAMKIIKLMMQTMGCDEDDLASFHKMGVTMNSLAVKDNSQQTIAMNIEYQHVLSWSWQVLKNTSNILISWCQAAVNKSSSMIFREIGVTLLRVLCQSRHRGTIECVAGCLQLYIQLGESYGLQNNWLTAREVAIDECIEGATKGRYSITRRSAGLPLVLMSALAGSSGTPLGSVLTSDCITRLMDLCNDNDKTIETNGWCDPPVVHYLNLMKQICQHPSLQPSLQHHYGNVIIITLSQFSSSNWGVRNAALQLFTTLLSRVVSITKGPSSNPTFSELFSLYPQLWNPIIKIINEDIPYEKSFMKHQTLIPTLTLLSNLEYCSDNLLPAGIHLHQLLQCFWPLLSSQVIAVRRLVAKCIINCLPKSQISWTVFRSHTRFIPIFYNHSDDLSNDIFASIPINQQHGELYLLKLLLSKLNNDEMESISVEHLLSFALFLSKKHCWFLLELVVIILLKISIPVNLQQSVKSFFFDQFHTILQFHSPSLSIGRLNVLVSIIKLLNLINKTNDVIVDLLFNDNCSDILQQICSDVNHSGDDPTILLSLFQSNISILISSVEKALINYKSYYTPYIIQLFCSVIDNFEDLRTPLHYNYELIIDLLNEVIGSSTLSETVVVNCQQIITWIYSKCKISFNDIYLTRWMNQMDKNMNFQSLETSRMSAVNNLMVLMTSDYFNYIIEHQPCELANTLTWGCFDESKSVRNKFRYVLNDIVHKNTRNHCAQLKKPYFIALYKILSEKSGVSSEVIGTEIWKTLICHQREFLDLVRIHKAKDVLYEPVPANIYIELSLILELLFRDLSCKSINKITIQTLIESHPRNISAEEIATNSAASFLSLSQQFLTRLLNDLNE